MIKLAPVPGCNIIPEEIRDWYITDVEEVAAKKLGFDKLYRDALNGHYASIIAVMQLEKSTRNNPGDWKTASIELKKSLDKIADCLASANISIQQDSSSDSSSSSSESSGSSSGSSSSSSESSSSSSESKDEDDKTGVQKENFLKDDDDKDKDINDKDSGISSSSSESSSSSSESSSSSSESSSSSSESSSSSSESKDEYDKTGVQKNFFSKDEDDEKVKDMDDEKSSSSSSSSESSSSSSESSSSSSESNEENDDNNGEEDDDEDNDDNNENKVDLFLDGTNDSSYNRLRIPSDGKEVDFEQEDSKEYFTNKNYVEDDDSNNTLNWDENIYVQSYEESNEGDNGDQKDNLKFQLKELIEKAEKYLLKLK